MFTSLSTTTCVSNILIGFPLPIWSINKSKLGLFPDLVYFSSHYVFACVEYMLGTSCHTCEKVTLGVLIIIFFLQIWIYLYCVFGFLVLQQLVMTDPQKILMKMMMEYLVSLDEIMCRKQSFYLEKKKFTSISYLCKLPVWFPHFEEVHYKTELCDKVTCSRFVV